MDIKRCEGCKALSDETEGDGWQHWATLQAHSGVRTPEAIHLCPTCRDKALDAVGLVAHPGALAQPAPPAPPEESDTETASEGTI